MPPTPDSEASAPARDALERTLEILARRGRRILAATPMAGDVSQRRYLRLTLRGESSGGTAVLALYPRELQGACERSLVSGRLLHEAGIRVAAVLDADCGRVRAGQDDATGRDLRERDEPKGSAGGWVLLEDLGPSTLYELARQPWSDLEPCFATAVDLLPRIAELPRQIVEDLNPLLDGALLRRELALTREAFLAPEGLDVEPPLWRCLERLCDRLGAEPFIPCHRDFGARNLIPLPSGASSTAVTRPTGLAVLDHQDLRLGPPFYDLASLLNDSLFPPAEAEERLLVRAGAGTGSARESYHRAAAQRTLKAVGSYAAFARRGGDRHVGLIRPTLERAIGHLRRVPETAAIAPELAERWHASLLD